MTLRITCPHCQAALTAPDSAAEKIARCAKCNQRFPITKHAASETQRVPLLTLARSAGFRAVSYRRGGGGGTGTIGPGEESWLEFCAFAPPVNRGAMQKEFSKVGVHVSDAPQDGWDFDSIGDPAETLRQALSKLPILSREQAKSVWGGYPNLFADMGSLSMTVDVVLEMLDAESRFIRLCVPGIRGTELQPLRLRQDGLQVMLARKFHDVGVDLVDHWIARIGDNAFGYGYIHP